MKLFIRICKPLIVVFAILIIQFIACNLCKAQSPLYFGTTALGGNQSAGAIIRFNPVTDNESVVWSFSNVSSQIKDGCLPVGTLVYDSISGLFYGTLKQSAVSYTAFGYIFSFNPLTNAENIVWTFGGSNKNDGSTPLGSLTLDPHNGWYYGMTSTGGINNTSNGGNGTIFGFNPANDSEKVVWSFGNVLAADGDNPSGDLVYNAKTGLFYGMTPKGLNGSDSGIIFSFNPANNQETVLWTFKGTPTDGVNPAASFVYDAGNGLYYANAYTGGKNDSGAIISFNPLTNEEKLAYSFKGGADGNGPTGNLTYNPTNGLLYGITEGRQVHQYGTIFSFNPSTGVEEALYHFRGDSTDVSAPVGSLLYNADSGLYYGNAVYGGLYANGGIFTFNPATNKERVAYSFLQQYDGSFPKASLAPYFPITYHSIATSTIANINYCAGDSVSVSFADSGSFRGGNVFTAQLSNANGNFTNAVAIGTIASTTAHAIKALIPSNTATGSGYRIRVVSSGPYTIGSDNGRNITINGIAIPVAKAGTAATASQITANWNATAGATDYFLDVSLHANFSSFVTGYNNLNAGNVTTYNITGLTPGTTYYYRVRATNTCGISGNSNTITYATTTCAALVAGKATPASSIICSDTTQVLTLTGESGGTLQWQISTDNISWNNVSSGGNAATYITRAVDGSTNKYYRCLSSNACYNAASATAMVGVSGPIQAVISNLTSSSVTLNWSPPGAGNYAVTYTGPTTGSQTNVTPPVTFTGLTGGSKYTFTIGGATPGCVYTEQISIRTLCSPPTALKTTSVTTTSVNLSWTGPTANYRVYYTQLFSSSTTTKTLDVSNSTTATLSALLPGATYEIYVAQKDCPATGNTGQPCAFIYATTTHTNACTPPVIDSVKSICSGQVKVWLHGNSSNRYTIYLQRLTPTLQPVSSYSISGNNLSFSPSIAGQTYVVAAASNCNGLLSNLAIWQAGVNVPAPCNALNNVLLSQPTCAGFTSSWNADNCSSNALNGYMLYVRKQGTITYGSYAVSAANSFKVINSLTPGATYQCFVRANYSCGSYFVYGPSSAVQSITTQSTGCRIEENDEQATEPAVQPTAANENESFTLYPNPNTGEFIIDLSRLTTEDESVRIEVLNMLGQTTLTQLTNINNGHLNEIIHLPGGASAGMYIVRVVAGKNIYTSKVSVNR